MFIYGAVLFALPGEELGARRARTTGPPTPRTSSGAWTTSGPGVYMQTLLRDPAAGIMHSLIYFGFLVLLAVTTVLEINHQLPESAKFLHGTIYQAYAFVGDVAGLVFLVGVVWAIVRRYVQRPYRIRIKSKPEHAVILGTLLSPSASPASSPRCSASPSTAARRSRSGPSSATRCRCSSRARHTSSGWHQALWIVHVLTFIAFLVILPITMLRHMFTSPLNMYLKDKDRPKGAMKPMPNLDGDRARDLRRLHHRGLHLEAAARHRRLHHVRPLHLGLPGARHRQAARPPRDRAQDRRGHGRAPATPQVSPPIGVDAEITVTADSALRAHHPRRGLGLHHLQGLRRDLPGQHRDPRQDPRHAPLPVAHGVELPDRAGQRLPLAWRTPATRGACQPERAGRLGQEARGHRDHRRRRPARPRVPLLGRLRRVASTTRTRRSPRPWPSCCSGPDIDFAILGPAENCTGDPARRSGNEYIFQMLAMQNIETLNGMGVKQDHHAVPALLQHARQRVPAARRQLRGRAPQPVPRVADRPRASST